MRKTLILLMVGLISWLQAAEADLICLKNANVLEGVIVKETDSALELEVFLGAKITFNKQDIAYIEKWSKEENLALVEKWLEDREERKEAELARQEFESQQKEKGLVKYKGKWISKPEKDKIKTREYVDEVLKAKVDRGEIVESRRERRTDISRALLAKGAWRHRQTEHFIVYYEDVIQSKIVADKAENIWGSLSNNLTISEVLFLLREKKKFTFALCLCLIFRLPSLTN